MAVTFASLIEAMGVEPPAKGVKEIWHQSVVGFGIRIAAPTKSGTVRRTYLARFDELQPDGRYKNEKPPLGLVTDIGSGDEVLTYDAAEAKARELVEAAKRRKAGGTVRLTVAAAWELLHEELRSPASLDAPTYADKIESIYERFLSHLGPRYLDQLTEGFWRQFATQIRGGTLRVGTNADGTPILRQAKSASYATAVFNAGARLYHIAHAHQGIEGKEKGWDTDYVRPGKQVCALAIVNFTCDFSLRHADFSGPNSHCLRHRHEATRGAKPARLRVRGDASTCLLRRPLPRAVCAALVQVWLMVGCHRGRAQ